MLRPFRLHWIVFHHGASHLSVRGRFRLRLEVVNCWPNRMIGDAMARANGAAEPKVDGKWPKWVLDGRSDSGTGIFTWTCWSEAFTPDYLLRESGLLGPVRLFVDLTQVSGCHAFSGVHQTACGRASYECMKENALFFHAAGSD